MFRAYLRLVLFALGLLVGIQVPGFIGDYIKRVDAHRLESEQGLAGFRDTAQRFFNADLQLLVEHYRSSSDPVIRSDARSVALLVERAALLSREAAAMQGHWYQQLWHLLSAADGQLLQETRQAYQYQVLLSPPVILWGLCAGLLLSWLLESLWLLLLWPWRRSLRRTAT